MREAYFLRSQCNIVKTRRESSITFVTQKVNASETAPLKRTPWPGKAKKKRNFLGCENNFNMWPVHVVKKILSASRKYRRSPSIKPPRVYWIRGIGEVWVWKSSDQGYDRGWGGARIGLKVLVRVGAKVARYAPLTGHTRAHSRLAWLLRGLTGFDYRGVPCKNGNHVNMRWAQAAALHAQPRLLLIGGSKPFTSSQEIKHSTSSPASAHASASDLYMAVTHGSEVHIHHTP